MTDLVDKKEIIGEILYKLYSKKLNLIENPGQGRYSDSGVYNSGLIDGIHMAMEIVEEECEVKTDHHDREQIKSYKEKVIAILEDSEMWKQELCYDMTLREKIIVRKAIEIVNCEFEKMLQALD